MSAAIQSNMFFFAIQRLLHRQQTQRYSEALCRKCRNTNCGNFYVEHTFFEEILLFIP